VKNPKLAKAFEMQPETPRGKIKKFPIGR